MSNPVRDEHTGRSAWFRASYGVLAFVCAVALAGCSIEGTWKTMTINPPGAPFPVDTVTFDGDGNYTATSTMDGRTSTSVGRYHAGASKLEITQAGNQTRTYGLHRPLDGSMVLTVGEGQRKITATLRQVEEQQADKQP